MLPLENLFESLASFAFVRDICAKLGVLASSASKICLPWFIFSFIYNAKKSNKHYKRDLYILLYFKV